MMCTYGVHSLALILGGNKSQVGLIIRRPVFETQSHILLAALASSTGDIPEYFKEAFCCVF